jgi:hypothetical protein
MSSAAGSAGGVRVLEHHNRLCPALSALLWVRRLVLGEQTLAQVWATPAVFVGDVLGRRLRPHRVVAVVGRPLIRRGKEWLLTAAQAKARQKARSKQHHPQV